MFFFAYITHLRSSIAILKRFTHVQPEQIKKNSETRRYSRRVPSSKNLNKFIRIIYYWIYTVSFTTKLELNNVKYETTRNAKNKKNDASH